MAATVSDIPEDLQAIIFDFDGVIVQSVETKTQAFAEIYRNEDPDKAAASVEYHHSHGGVNRRDKFRYFERSIFGRPGEDTAIDTLSLRFTELVHDAVIRFPFVDGAVEVLQAAQGHLPLHLVSETQQVELEGSVNQRELRPLFKQVIGAPTSKYDAFNVIIESEAYEPAKAMAIGDSVTEFHAAEALGMPFLGIVAGSLKNPFPRNVTIFPLCSVLIAFCGWINRLKPVEW